MSSRDVSADSYRRQDSIWRRRGHHYSPAKKNQGDNAERNARDRDCDFTYSTESLRSHFWRTDQKPWDDGKAWNAGGRTENPWRPDPAPSNASKKQRRPDPAPSNASEKQRRPDPAPSNASEKQRRPDPAPSNASEKQRRPDPAPSNTSEKQRRPDPAPSNALEKQRRPDPAPSNASEKQRRPDPAPSNASEKQRRPDPATSNASEKQRRPDPATSNASEKQRRPDPAPSDASEKQKKPDPMPSVPGMIPEHIRRSVFVLKDYIGRKDREPIIGLEYILEYKVQVNSDEIKTKYFCEICEMDSGVVPMLDHLCGFKHRKLYCGKEYPYVLKALFSTKEDRAVFMRRMATEIEKEEGTKTYKMDPLIRMVPVMNVKSTEAKQSKRKTRWDSEGDRQKKMKQALDYLDLYKVDSEAQATAVEKLLEKLTADLKFHTDKLKEEALFPAKVARARDVAMSLMRNAVRAWIKPLFPGLRGPMQRIPPLLNSEPPENINLDRSGDHPCWTPNTDFPQKPQGSPFNQKHYYEMAENIWKDQNANPNPEPDIDPTDEDIEFFNKLMALLAVLPDDSPAGQPQTDPELPILKSFLDKMENTPANPPMQFASLSQDMASMENKQLNRMTSSNPTAPMGQSGPNVTMPVSSVANNAGSAERNPLMRLHNSQRIGDQFLPENQNREYIEMGSSSSVMPMDQGTYRRPYMERQPGFPNPSRNDEDFGNKRGMAGKFGNKRRSRFDNPAKPIGYMPNEATREMYADRNSGMYNREWDKSSYSNKRGDRQYEDYVAEENPYSRVSLPPSIQRSEEERFRDGGYHRDLSRDDTRPGYGGRRPFDDPAWVEREGDARFAKRAKLDGDCMTSHNTERGRRRPDDSGSRSKRVL
ncbi:uncharacterized protein ACMZJ9_003605 [Mantella aurantiaca]